MRGDLATGLGLDDLEVGRKPATGGPGHWSLAALAIGCTLVLMAPVTLLFALFYGVNAGSYLNAGATRLALVSSIMGLFVVLGLAVTSVIAAALGLREAKDTGVGRGLALMALLASIAGVVLWLDTGAHLIITMIDALR
jgi:hypothetical protein